MQSRLEIIERAKAEIIEDILNGTLPVMPTSFDELHEYVDANEYGGFTEDNATTDYDFIVDVQTELGVWLSPKGI